MDRWTKVSALLIVFIALSLGVVQAAPPIKECSAFNGTGHGPEYKHCPSDVFIQHASSVQDWNITDGELVTLVGKNLPANAAVIFGVACVGYAEEPATADRLGVASWGPCTAVVDPSLGAMNCAFIYWLGPDGFFHTLAYRELTPI